MVCCYTGLQISYVTYVTLYVFLVCRFTGHFFGGYMTLNQQFNCHLSAIWLVSTGVSWSFVVYYGMCGLLCVPLCDSRCQNGVHHSGCAGHRLP